MRRQRGEYTCCQCNVRTATVVSEATDVALCAECWKEVKQAFASALAAEESRGAFRPVLVRRVRGRGDGGVQRVPGVGDRAMGPG